VKPKEMTERTIPNENQTAEEEARSESFSQKHPSAQGEADEPDAPTAEEENEGMSTILSAEPILGVQEDAGEE
jgi:hypothetical protein